MRMSTNVTHPHMWLWRCWKSSLPWHRRRKGVPDSFPRPVLPVAVSVLALWHELPVKSSGLDRSRRTMDEQLVSLPTNRQIEFAWKPKGVVRGCAARLERILRPFALGTVVVLVDAVPDIVRLCRNVIRGQIRPLVNELQILARPRRAFGDQSWSQGQYSRHMALIAWAGRWI